MDLLFHGIDESVIRYISRSALGMREDEFFVVIFDFAGDDVSVADDEDFGWEITIEKCDIADITDHIMKLYLIELLRSSGELLLGDDLSDDGLNIVTLGVEISEESEIRSILICPREVLQKISH